MTELAETRRRIVEGRKLTAAERSTWADTRDRLDTASFTLGREGDDAMRDAYRSDDPRDFRRLSLLACSRYAQAAMKASQAKAYQDDLDRGWTR